MKAISRMSNETKIKLLILFIGIISFLVARNILNGFLQGDDEALFMAKANAMLYEFKHEDIKDVWLILRYHDHPPAPLLILMLSIAIFGFNIVALRLPNILLWTTVCMMATKIGWRLGGLKTGLLSGIFLAISGVYDMEALGFGMSFEVLGVMLLINVLLDKFAWNLETLDARKKYLFGGIYLALSHLFYTSILPVIGIYHAWFAFKTYKSNPTSETIKKYIVYTLPFIAFYIIYNLIFLGIPAYEVYTQGIAPYGQLSQTLGRASSFINYESFLVNLRVLNWFVLPFFSWLILAIALYSQIKKSFDIFIVMLSYGLVWSFYVRVNTGQHFLAYFCWSLPFAIVFLTNLLSTLKPYFQLSLWGLLLSTLLTWTYLAHIKIYSYDSYPRALITLTWAEPLGWINNMYRPVNKIARTLDKRLGPNGKYISLIDSAFNLFYFTEDSNYPLLDSDILETRQNGIKQCLWLNRDVIKTNKIKAVVSYSNQSFCPDLVGEEINYPGSNLKLSFLK